jgi:thioesterase domain-containing protein
MRQIQPAGPYSIVAMCAGSFIALEMCSQLVDAGQSIARFILLDPDPTPRGFVWRDPAEVGIRRWRSRAKSLPRLIYKKIAKASRGRARAWRGPMDPYKSYEKELGVRAKRLGRIRDTIEKRRAGEIDWASPEERSYSPEKMLEASQQLLNALRTHVPRPYAGKAAILVRSGRGPDLVRDGSFWRHHLGGIDWSAGASTHGDLFDAQIVETARFVRRVLESPS